MLNYFYFPLKQLYFSLLLRKYLIFFNKIFGAGYMIDSGD